MLLNVKMQTDITSKPSCKTEIDRWWYCLRLSKVKFPYEPTRAHRVKKTEKAWTYYYYLSLPQNHLAITTTSNHDDWESKTVSWHSTVNIGPKIDCLMWTFHAVRFQLKIHKSHKSRWIIRQTHKKTLVLKRVFLKTSRL